MVTLFTLDEERVKELSENEIGLPPVKHVEEPDGGYGWLIVFGAFLVQVTSFGTATSWGMYQ
jgi:hypothetical protein